MFLLFTPKCWATDRIVSSSLYHCNRFPETWPFAKKQMYLSQWLKLEHPRSRSPHLGTTFRSVIRKQRQKGRSKGKREKEGKGAKLDLATNYPQSRKCTPTVMKILKTQNSLGRMCPSLNMPHDVLSSVPCPSGLTLTRAVDG